MVVYKRRQGTEREVQKGNDSYVEVDDRRSYNDSQTEITDNDLYTKRESFSTKKQHEEVMPSIKKEARPAPVAKQSVSSKTKVLLAAYIVIAIVLAAVVIGTGVAISEIGTRTDALENRLGQVSIEINTQNNTLAVLDDESHIIGEATKFDMEVIGDRALVNLAPTVDATEYQSTTNAFDKLCDFLTRIFG